MTGRSQGYWVVLLTLLVASLLAIVPFPVWAMDFRPEWVALVTIYWAMALPFRFGIGSAWVVGLFMDMLEGSILGLNAMVLAILAYITLSLHKRLRMFSPVQQSGLIFALVGLDLILSHWLQLASGNTVSSNLMFLMGALTSAVLWPFIFQSLRQLRRAFHVN